jgi:hypothetical protein
MGLGALCGLGTLAGGWRSGVGAGTDHMVSRLDFSTLSRGYCEWWQGWWHGIERGLWVGGIGVGVGCGAADLHAEGTLWGRRTWGAGGCDGSTAAVWAGVKIDVCVLKQLPGCEHYTGGPQSSCMPQLGVLFLLQGQATMWHSSPRSMRLLATPACWSTCGRRDQRENMQTQSTGCCIR